MIRSESVVWSKVVAAVCGNLAAAWFGLGLVSPAFNVFASWENMARLIQLLAFGILFMWLAVQFEKLAK